MTRHVTDEHDPRSRFGLYRLCECPQCEGCGKRSLAPYAEFGAGFPIDTERCPDCRGEGRIRQCVAECETPEAVGVALVTCAREGEWTSADGDPCAFGLLDRTPKCETCEGSGRSTVWLAGSIPRNVGPCETCKGSGIKPTGTWLVLPWMPSARNVRDAGRVLGA